MPEYHKAENFNIIDNKPHLIFSLRGWNLRLIDAINFVVCLMFCLPTKNISVFKVFENAAKEICWNLKYLFSSWTFKSFTPPEKEPSINVDTQVFTVYLYLKPTMVVLFTQQLQKPLFALVINVLCRPGFPKPRDL